MELKIAIREVFGGKELTMTPIKVEIKSDPTYGKKYFKSGICTLNKWSLKRKSIDVTVELYKILVDLNILELDSGNLDTGEAHYTYNRQLNDHKEIDIQWHPRICELIK